MDEIMKSAVAKQGFQLDSIVPEGQKVSLYEIPLQGTGANNVDVTELVHPDIKQTAICLATTFDIAICGIDFISEDISRSFLETGKFIEINNTPSMRGHLVDGEDIREIGATVLGEDLSRIPVEMYVVGPGHLNAELRLRNPQPGQGWVIGKQVGIGKTDLLQRTPLLHARVRTLLINRVVESIVVVCSTDELQAEGLPVDRLDHVYLQDSSIDTAWRKVLSHCSRQLTETADFHTIRTQLGLVEK
jgi:cyanophycin synthetase